MTGSSVHLGLLLSLVLRLVRAELNLTVPDYATRYAPLLWLHSDDPYKPSDLATHIKHTTPVLNGKPIPDLPSLDLDNLEILNEHGKHGEHVALNSNDDPTDYPAWLYGEAPDSAGRIHNSTPCVVVLVEKSDLDVDAFYFYFYSYNEGGDITQVLPPMDWLVAGPEADSGMHFGDHVGDWEHNMIRFHNGIPTGIYFSQHIDGVGYEWDDVTVAKTGDRPVVYSARGSHANYATPGIQVHNAALADYCDQGQTWDPVLSAYFYSFDPDTSKFTTLNQPNDTITSPSANLTSFLYFSGRWGDMQFPDSDSRQYSIPYFGIRRFQDGPTGPRDKHLVRDGLLPGHRKKGWLELSVVVFMILYPYMFKGWRKWITLGCFVVFVSLIVLAIRFGVVSYRRRAYTKVGDEDMQLDDWSREEDGLYTSDGEEEEEERIK